MFKEVFRNLDLQWLGDLALLMFFGCFIAICCWALTRPGKEMETCRRLPLEENPS